MAPLRSLLVRGQMLSYGSQAVNCSLYVHSHICCVCSACPKTHCRLSESFPPKAEICFRWDFVIISNYLPLTISLGVIVSSVVLLKLSDVGLKKPETVLGQWSAVKGMLGWVWGVELSVLLASSLSELGWISLLCFHTGKSAPGTARNKPGVWEKLVCDKEALEESGKLSG